jgi:hypothetical protein
MMACAGKFKGADEGCRALSFLGAARCYFNSFELQRRALHESAKRVKLAAAKDAGGAHVSMDKGFIDGVDDLFEAYALWDKVGPTLPSTLLICGFDPPPHHTPITPPSHTLTPSPSPLLQATVSPAKDVLPPEGISFTSMDIGIFLDHIAALPAHADLMAA